MNQLLLFEWSRAHPISPECNRICLSDEDEMQKPNPGSSPVSYVGDPGVFVLHQSRVSSAAPSVLTSKVEADILSYCALRGCDIGFGGFICPVQLPSSLSCLHPL